MNSDIIIKVLQTQHSSSTGVKILELLIPTLITPLSSDDLTNVLSLSCFSYSSDKKNVLDILLKQDSIVINMEVFNKVMDLFNSDKELILNKLLAKKDVSVTFDFVKKYITKSMDESILFNIVDSFKGETINLYELFDSIRSSHITDKARYRLVHDHVTDQLDPEKLSEYFCDYNIFAKICEEMNIDQSEYEKYEEKINEDNKTIIIFGIKHTIDMFPVNEPYIINGTCDSLNKKEKETLKFHITRNVDNSIKIDGRHTHSHGGFHTMTLAVHVTRGLVIDLNGLVSQYK
ncbi:MAG: hypothetical protein Terrestrivirus6_62 [Terrestrivirus sp.]|uniref:Uncharacterized protein n=1 Tax=Terrestrivirus sp. TaxID=2487775 RepID=A0A3G4ZNI7_9VIRU|nr:MAG: hypothetical protein Terrestrivirus6_62 [Terrestrivirus sp.]